MSLEKKAILVIIDGAGDRVVREGKTTLQLAKKPTLDELAREGSVGLMNALGPGVIPGSDTSHLAIFGYEPSIYYKGRGPLEALGVGINLKEGDIAFRCNFATVDKELRVIDRRAGRLKDEGKELAKSLQGMNIEGVEIIFASSTEHRGVLVLRGESLSSDISDTDPHIPRNTLILESEPLNSGKEAKRTAKIVNEVVRRSKNILSSHPINKQREKEGKLSANIILTRGAGTYQKVESLKDRCGFDSCCIAGAALYKGIAKYVGMEVLEVSGATGRIDTNIEAKALAAREALKKFDFVFIHIKGADNASHDGKLEDKLLMIEKTDKLANLLKREDAYLIVTADHSTPISIKRHSSDSVPLLIYGDDIRKDKVKIFDEISASSGCLGHLTGIQLNRIIIDLMGCGHMVGS